MIRLSRAQTVLAVAAIGAASALAAGAAVPAMHAISASSWSPTCKARHWHCPAPTPTSPILGSVSSSPVQTPTTPTPTPTSATPTPTTPTPTTATPTPAGTGTTAACVASTDNGGCGPYDYPGITGSNGYNTNIQNNVWNAIPGWQQSVTAYDPGNWGVQANMPTGNTAVVSYPEVQQVYTRSDNTPAPLSGFSSITSAATETMKPQAGTIAEAAWDIWSSYSSDIMIWNDTAGRCNSGAYGSTTLGTGITIGGHTYDAYRYGGPGAEIIFVEEGPGGVGTCAQDATGTADILGVMNWLIADGILPASTGLSQVDYGWEICSTGGQPENFAVSAYSITTS